MKKRGTIKGVSWIATCAKCQNQQSLSTNVTPPTDLFRNQGWHHNKNLGWLCPNCKLKTQKPAVYVSLICEECGKLFQRQTWYIERMERRGKKVRWCGNVCKGKHWGKSNQKHKEKPCDAKPYKIVPMEEVKP